MALTPKEHDEEGDDEKGCHDEIHVFCGSGPNLRVIPPTPFLDHFFWVQISTRFWYRFGSDFGRSLGAKTLPKHLSQTISKKEPEQKTQKREIAIHLNVFCCFLGSTWSPNGPKSGQNRHPNGSENEVEKITQKTLSKITLKCIILV